MGVSLSWRHTTRNALISFTIVFFRHLATRDAWRHRPLLRRLAREGHPGVKESDFIICIDYCKFPPEYSLILLADYETKQQPRMNGSANAEARNDAFIERARQNPGKFTLIQSQVSNGSGTQLVTSVVTGNFWHCEEGAFGPSSEDEDELAANSDQEDYRNTDIDEVDIIRAKLILNRIAASIGETTDL